MFGEVKNLDDFPAYEHRGCNLDVCLVYFVRVAGFNERRC